MKITNPSVTLKDGLWYGYTVEVPEEPDYCTMTECDPYELCGCRKNKIYYEESLDSANASLVKISNQEEVSRIVLKCSPEEDLKKSVHRRLSELDLYRLEGYEMEVKQHCAEYNADLPGCDTCAHDCYKPEKVATISPIQKQEERPIEELFLEEYYRLPADCSHRGRINTDYGDLVNLLTMFKEKYFTITRKP